MQTPKPLLLCAILLALAAGFTAVRAQDEHGHGMSAEHQEYAHEAPRQQSMLLYTFNAIGWRYTLALPLAGLLAFVLALIVVLRGGPSAGPALLFIVPIPLLVGVMGFFDGMVMSFNVIALSEAAPKPNQIADGIATSLVTPIIGMLLMAPAYFVAMGGLFLRTLAGEREPKQV
jgi:hypothetical protein